MNNITSISHKINATAYGGLNVLYLNINSIRNKIDEIEIYIANNKNNTIHIIALTEIRITYECNEYYQLNNYKAYFCNRDSGDGGVAIYVHNSIQTCEIVNECHLNINFLCVSIIHMKFKIAVLYKQPKVTNSIFLRYLNDKLLTMKRLLLIGDMNYDLLKEENNEIYMNMAQSNGYTVLNKIQKKHATRVAQKTNMNETHTIIDHALTDLNEFIYTLCINHSHISDHKQINISINFTQKNMKHFACNEIEVRAKKINIQKYKELIGDINYTEIHTFEQLNTKLNACKNQSIHEYKHTRKINPYKQWVDQQLLKLIQERNRYHKLLKRCPDNDYLINKYKNIQCEIQNKRKLARSEYNSNKLNSNMGHPKLLWRTINEIISNTTRQENGIQAMAEVDNNNKIIENVVNTEKTKIANTLNRYFGNVGKVLYNNIGNTVNDYTTSSSYVHNSIFINRVTITEIENNIYKMKNSKTWSTPSHRQC